MIYKASRKAILIGCPGARSNYLSAVEYDLKKVKNYLLSNRGGRWFDNEILVLNNPSTTAALNIVKSIVADYVIVYFTGHGWADKTRKKYLCFSDGSIEDLYFLNDCPRQLIIVDACRKVQKHAISGFPDEDRFLHADGYYPARNLFDYYILNSPVGKTVVHATAHDTYADAYQSGSVFTDTLLKTCYSIKTENYAPLNLVDVINQTSINLAKKGNKQIPWITYNKGNLQIPFGLGFEKSYPRNRHTVAKQGLQKKHPTTKDSTSTALALLGIGLVIYAALGSGK